MNYLQIFAEFTTVEEGVKNYLEAQNLRDRMGGDLYWNCLNDDCKEIF